MFVVIPIVLTAERAASSSSFARRSHILMSGALMVIARFLRAHAHRLSAETLVLPSRRHVCIYNSNTHHISATARVVAPRHVRGNDAAESPYGEEEFARNRSLFAPTRVLLALRQGAVVVRQFHEPPLRPTEARSIVFARPPATLQVTCATEMARVANGGTVRWATVRRCRRVPRACAAARVAKR